MLSKKKRISSVKTSYVPQFSSQLSSVQGEEPQSDQAEPPSQCRGARRENRREQKNLLKVKIPKSKKTTTQDKGPRGLVLELPAPKTTANIPRGGGKQSAATQSDSVVKDAFYFSDCSTSKPLTEKEKAKLSVLRTIARMLEENEIIRERLTALS